MSTELTRATPVGLAIAGRPILGWLLRGGFFLAVLGGTYFIVRKVILEIRRRKLLDQAGTNTADGLAIGYANRCYAAMFRGATEWYSDWVGDGTDEDAIFQVAREMRANGINLALVSDKYRTLYDRPLLQDLTRELDAGDLATFQNLLATGMGGPAGLALVIDSMIVSTAPTTVYDEHLQPVQQIPAGGRLGEHIGTLVQDSGHQYHEFYYAGQLRRVPAAATILKRF